MTATYSSNQVKFYQMIIQKPPTTIIPYQLTATNMSRSAEMISVAIFKQPPEEIAKDQPVLNLGIFGDMMNEDQVSEHVRSGIPGAFITALDPKHLEQISTHLSEAGIFNVNIDDDFPDDPNFIAIIRINAILSDLNNYQQLEEQFIQSINFINQSCQRTLLGF